MKKVLVLLSSYNGERFIEEQIDSILSSIDIDVSILVRDDGSSDNTLIILKEYSEKHSNITYLIGDNCGSNLSFCNLVKEASLDYDYYAFCDQDDIWEKDKLLNAVTILEEYDNNNPSRYYSNALVVDEKLNPIDYLHKKPCKTDKYVNIIRSQTNGNTMVFNKKAIEFYKSHNPMNKNIGHDSYMNLICCFLGNVYYDPKPRIKYRQHENNVVGAVQNKKFDIYVVKRIKKHIKEIDYHPRENTAKFLYDSIHTIIDKKSKKELYKIVNYRKSFISKLVLLFDFNLHDQDLIHDLHYRFSIITGRV